MVILDIQASLKTIWNLITTLAQLSFPCSSVGTHYRALLRPRPVSSGISSRGTGYYRSTGTIQAKT
jgi:hypothetical protein